MRLQRLKAKHLSQSKSGRLCDYLTGPVLFEVKRPPPPGPDVLRAEDALPRRHGAFLFEPQTLFWCTLAIQLVQRENCPPKRYFASFTAISHSSHCLKHLSNSHCVSPVVGGIRLTASTNSGFSKPLLHDLHEVLNRNQDFLAIPVPSEQFRT